MPEERAVDQVPYVSLESEDLKLGQDPISSAYALTLVTSTFFQYENFRTMNHDRRWNVHEALYFMWVPPKVWDGTAIPRSSLGNGIVFDQTESAMSAISQALFNDDEDWFQVQGEETTTPEEARQLKEALNYTVEHVKNDAGMTARNEFQLATKDVLLYGNGGGEVVWDAKTNQPRFQWVDVRDFYIDPGLAVPNIDEARSVIRRKLLTIDELEDLRVDKRLNIPPRDVLVYMSRRLPMVAADRTKQLGEALRGVLYQPPVNDWSPLPSDRKIEVLIYYSKTRIIWVLNRQWIAYNESNPFGFYPFSFAPCYIVPSRFYAQSIADVQEGNQRYIEALLNGRLDEIALDLHPPRIMRQGALMTPAQQRWRPGAVYQVKEPDDMSVVQDRRQPLNIYEDVQYIETMADKRTGINSLSQGVPHPSNANRTLGGMQMQQGGANARLQPIVKNIEDYLIVPSLYKMAKYMEFYLNPNQQVPATSQEGGASYVPAALFAKPVKFKILGASRMLTQQKLAQVVPYLAQYLLQGPLVEQLHSAGKTVDYDEFAQMLQDSTGTGQMYKLITDLTPQQMQQMQQMQQQKQSPDMQQAQLDSQTRIQLMNLKNQGNYQVAQLKNQPDPMAAQQAQMEMQQAQQQAAMEAQQQQQQQQADMLTNAMKLRMEAALNQQKMQHERAKTLMDLQKKHADIQLKTREGLINHALKIREGNIKARQQVQQGHIANIQALQQARQQQTSNTIDLQHQKETHKQDLGHAKDLNQAKVAATRAIAAAKPKPTTKK